MDLTFFEYPGAAPGVAGAGMVHRIVWRVASSEALEFWKERLDGQGVEADLTDDSLLFADPEGLEHELVLDTTDDQKLSACSPEIPAEHALQGFDGVRAYSNDPPRSQRLLGEALGFTRRAGETWEVRGERRGSVYAYDPAPPEINRRQGAGSVHHVAFASRMEDIEQWRTRVAEAGARPDPGDRTLLLQIRLLPGAQRRAVRDRHDRSRLRDRRGRGAPGRAPVAAGPLRADARAARAYAEAPALPARLADGSLGLLAAQRGPAARRPSVQRSACQAQVSGGAPDKCLMNGWDDRGIVDQSALRMREATFAAGIWLTYVVCGASALYIVLTWERPYRTLIALLFGAGLVGAVAISRLDRASGSSAAATASPSSSPGASSTSR